MVAHALLILALTLAAAPAVARQDGQAVYAANCAACHQASGAGIKGAFPALAGDAFVAGDPARLIGRVLAGKSAMPPFAASLSDDQIAAVLTYVRGAWGNSGAAVTPAQVAAARAAMVSH
ncbi:MAG: c-type cytochrome [Caulobacteraceae bacterium]